MKKVRAGKEYIYKPEDINNLVDNLSEEQAKFMLIRAVQMAYKHGLYSLTESEIVSKSLRILNWKKFWDSIIFCIFVKLNKNLWKI